MGESTEARGGPASLPILLAPLFKSGQLNLAVDRIDQSCDVPHRLVGDENDYGDPDKISAYSVIVCPGANRLSIALIRVVCFIH